jgi:hypothetical protein
MYEGILVDVAFAGFFFAMMCNDRPEHHAILISLLQWLGKQKSFLDDLASILIFTKDSSSSSTIPATRKTYLSISPSRLKVRFIIIINVRRHSPICVPLEFGIEDHGPHSEWKQRSSHPRESAAVHSAGIALPSQYTAERGFLRGSFGNH